MTDPNTPAPDGQQPTPPPAAPRYGEYAAQSTPPAQPAPTAPPAYTAPAYGAAPAYDPAAYGTAPGAPVPGKTLGIVAFVLAFFANIIGVILGIVALVQSKKAGAKNGFALAAIIVGSVLFVLGVIALILFIVAINAVAGSDLVSQINDCIDNPSGSVVYQGVTMSCQELLDQSGR